MKNLSLLLWLGYPPLIAYLVPVILLTVKKTNSDNILDGVFFFISQYLTIILFPLFHFLISIRRQLSTVILIQVVSMIFCWNAGASLLPVAYFTEGFTLENRTTNVAMIVGLPMLIVVQFYGYIIWPIFVLREIQPNLRGSNLIQRNSKCTPVFLVAALIGLNGLVMYLASSIINWIKSDYAAYNFPICTHYALFCKVTQLVPAPLFLMTVFVEGMFVFWNKKRTVFILSQVTSLLNLFLGYSVHVLTYALSYYVVYHRLDPFPLNGFTHLTVILYIVQFVGCHIMILSTAVMNIVWVVMFYFHTKADTAPVVIINTQEVRPLLPNSSEYFRDTIPVVNVTSGKVVLDD